MHNNNGYITSKELTSLGISREYLRIMLKQKKIEKLDNGIYVDINKFEDSYYTFNIKFPKTIFSHMTALYFYDLAEKVPYDKYDITVEDTYNNKKIRKHNVFYVKKDILNIGLTKVTTPSGNMIRCYDKERCICDIIRSKKRMDEELVKKSVKGYLKRNDKDLLKLQEYAEKMGIKTKVLNYVGMFYE